MLTLPCFPPLYQKRIGLSGVFGCDLRMHVICPFSSSLTWLQRYFSKIFFEIICLFQFNNLQRDILNYLLKSVYCFDFNSIRDNLTSFLQSLEIANDSRGQTSIQPANYLFEVFLRFDLLGILCIAFIEACRNIGAKLR